MQSFPRTGSKKFNARAWRVIERARVERNFAGRKYQLIGETSLLTSLTSFLSRESSWRERGSFLFFKYTFKLQPVYVCHILALWQLYIICNMYLKDVKWANTSVSPAPNTLNVDHVLLCALPLLLRFFTNCWANLGNELGAYSLPAQSGWLQSFHVRWLWWHQWFIKARPSWVQSPKWQMPSQAYLLLRLEVINYYFTTYQLSI